MLRTAARIKTDLLFFLFPVLGGLPAASAAITITGSGPGANGGTVSAQAEFSVSGNILTIVLTNTSAPTPTGNNGQVVTGIIWSFDPKLDGSLSLYGVNPQLTSTNDHIWAVQSSGGGVTTYAINDSLSLGGTWTDKTSSVFASSGLGDFGYATTGADGLFAMGTIVGPSPGSANFGLVSDATYPTNPYSMPSGYGPQSLPLVQNSITVRFYYDGATLNENQIVDVKFLVGTAGNYITPEPASIFLWGAAMVLAGFVGRKRALRHASRKSTC